MTPTSSNWRLTFGVSYVLLDYGWLLTEELKFPLRNGDEVVPSPDSSWPLVLGTGNAAVQLRFATLHTMTTDLAARENILDRLIGFSGYGVQPLKVEVYGITDRYWSFAQCSVSECDMDMVPHPTKTRLRRAYSLTLAGLTKTTI